MSMLDGTNKYDWVTTQNFKNVLECVFDITAINYVSFILFGIFFLLNYEIINLSGYIYNEQSVYLLLKYL